MTWGVDDEETGNLELELAIGVDDRRLLLDCIDREVRCADLLRDASRLALLDVGLPDLVEQLGLSGIDVPENTANRRAEVVL